MAFLKLYKNKFLDNIKWNLLGLLVPLISAFLSIPILISKIGNDKFGMLSVAWIIVGYFSLFDFGIGRAMTKSISSRLSDDNKKTIPLLISSGLIILSFISLFITILLVFLSESICFKWLKVPLYLQLDSYYAFIIISLAIPFTILTTGCRGILEAYQKFKLLNILKIPLGSMLFVAPVVAVYFSNSLVCIFSSLVLTRLIGAIFFIYFSINKIPDFKAFSFSYHEARLLLKEGGWINVSNIISPVMVQMDRFFIGGLLGVALIAYYTTPYEIVSKILIIPAAISGVAFPAFASMYLNDVKALLGLYKKTLLYCTISIFPVLICVCFSEFLLDIWLGGDFSKQSSFIMQVLAIAILVNGLAHVPYAFLQAIGHAKFVAILHLIEALFYIPLLIILIKLWGINGVAIAWLVRSFVDAFFLFLMANIKCVALKKY